MLMVKRARRSLRPFGFLAAGLFASALVGCSAQTANPDAGSSSTPSTAAPVPAAAAAPATTVANVEISAFSYKPSELTVPAGTTVVWTNQDGITHTVSSGTSDHPGGPLNGTLPGKGATYSFKFDSAGEYPYFCNFHPVMVGKIIVKQP